MDAATPRITAVYLIHMTITTGPGTTMLGKALPTLHVTIVWCCSVIGGTLFFICLVIAGGCGGWRYRRYYVVRRTYQPVAPTTTTTVVAATTTGQSTIYCMHVTCSHNHYCV